MSGDDTRFSGLLDAEQRHRAEPDSFSIPRSDVRRALAPGDIVKLLFGVGPGDPPSAERMWVEVLEVEAQGYLGRLDNEPQVIGDLELGALVRFGPEHVAAVYQQTHEWSPRPDHLAVVSDAIWQAGERPARALRMSAPEEPFSGWVVFGPTDPTVPPEDLSGFQPISHQALTDRYRSFDSIEDEPPRSAWRWDPHALEWRREPS